MYQEQILAESVGSINKINLNFTEIIDYKLFANRH